jgi:hypothetical protein
MAAAPMGGFVTLELFHSHDDAFFLKPLPIELFLNVIRLARWLQVVAVVHHQSGTSTTAKRTVQVHLN